MYLSQLNLQNFRSYKKSEFNFSQKTTLIAGPNTAGKTNIIEAIYLLSTGKSFRAGKDVEMISLGEEMGRASAQIQNSKFKIQNCEEESFSSFTGEKPSNALSLEVVLTVGQVNNIKTPFKKYLVNGVGKRRADFASNLKTVLFSPLDLDIISGSPSLRRNFLDEILEQTDYEYRLALISFVKALRQRNALLERAREDGFKNEKLFEYWDNLIIKNGELISLKREELVVFLNKEKKDIFEFEIFYDKSVISKERLMQYKDAEVGAGVTLVGPHRDDLMIRMENHIKDKSEYQNTKSETNSNDKNSNVSNISKIRDFENCFDIRNSNSGFTEKFVDVKFFGSRGQQRLAVLQLKLLQILFIEKASGERPLLLLDDIFSELDEGHIQLVTKMIGSQQTIVTTTHKELVSKDAFGNFQTIDLLKG